MDLKEFIHAIPDFPKPGILFRDISPLLKNPQAMAYVSQNLVLSQPLANIARIL